MAYWSQNKYGGTDDVINNNNSITWTPIINGTNSLIGPPSSNRKYISTILIGAGTGTDTSSGGLTNANNSYPMDNSYLITKIQAEYKLRT